jgi:uncharacterized RDD family membrane protein YckC
MNSDTLKFQTVPNQIYQIAIYLTLFLMVAVCLFAFFNDKRQALHDIFAKTLVYKKY